MGQALASEVIDGVRLDLPRRAYVDGNDAVFYLPHGALAPGRSYSVTLERGVVSAADGSPFTLTAAWSFRAAALGARPAGSWTVALDGSGDFCTLQGAIDAVPAGNTAPLTIQLAPGTYHEIVRWRAKHQLTIKGQARELVTISGVNNEQLNSGTAKRALIGVDDSHGITIEDLTIRNLTPQDGSQAEALRMQSCDECSVRRVNVHSLQDTLLWSGRIYARDCYIEGNVDYVWGTGAAYFDHCELHTTGRKGYIVQARNPASSYGYVFVDCRLTGDPGIHGDILARIDASAYPASQVAFIGCEMGGHIDPSGWLVSGGGSTQSLRFSEYGSTQPGGAALDLSRRLPSATQLTAEQAAALRDPRSVLRGWTPD
jgi:pectin methylesterase-like acyl-CoA thioesterase